GGSAGDAMGVRETSAGPRGTFGEGQGRQDRQHLLHPPPGAPVAGCRRLPRAGGVIWQPSTVRSAAREVGASDGQAVARMSHLAMCFKFPKCFGAEHDQVSLPLKMLNPRANTAP